MRCSPWPSISPAGPSWSRASIPARRCGRSRNSPPAPAMSGWWGDRWPTSRRKARTSTWRRWSARTAGRPASSSAPPSASAGSSAAPPTDNWTTSPPTPSPTSRRSIGKPIRSASWPATAPPERINGKGRVMKALVTGSTGFVGAAVTRCLLEHGVDVRALVRRDSDLRNLEGLKVEQAYGDLRDVASLRQALAGCRHLYHVAALYALWAPDPQTFYDTNVTGTRNLMAAARDSSVERIVYTSPIGAIGLPPGGGPGTEDTPVSLEQMVGHYKRSKFLAEQEVRTLARAGLPVVIVNPSAPVGAHDIKPTPTGQVIVDFMKGRMPAYIETGMNLVDVDDVAAGHLLAMEKGRIGERYILGNRNLMLREVFAILSRLTGVPAPTLKLPRWSILPLAYANQWLADYVTHRPPRIPLEGVKMAKYVMHYDCSKALRELGLPQTPVEVALEKAVRWFRDHRYA